MPFRDQSQPKALLYILSKDGYTKIISINEGYNLNNLPEGELIAVENILSGQSDNNITDTI